MTSALARRAVQIAYDNLLRPHLPRKWGVFGGVPARDVRLLDATDYLPNYKAGLREAITRHVNDGDEVVLVGFGRGISTVWCVESGATVTAYEGAARMCEIGRETITAADITQAVTVEHGIVGEANLLYGKPDGAAGVAPDELPESNVLVMDCEGAETSILAGLEDPPSTLIIETHPERGVPPEAVQDELTALEYEVAARIPYKPENDKPVFVAKPADRVVERPAATDQGDDG